MSDKKLTDNEIIKALECCCTYKGKCIDCPAFVKVDRSNCKQVLLGAIEIITRQQAEIERLKKSNEMFTDIGKMYSEIKSEAYKEFAERLKEKSSSRFDYSELVFEISEYDIDNLVKEMVCDDKVNI